MLSTEFIPYNRANESTFQSIFLPEDYRDGIFAINDFVELLEYIVSNVRALLLSHYPHKQRNKHFCF